MVLAPAPVPEDSGGNIFPKRTIWTAVTATAAIVFAFGAVAYLRNGSGWASKQPDRSVATFVGSETCAGCHQGEAKLWNASQHKAAMQHATDTTVLGDFNDASFDHYGIRSRFFRKDNKFLVETDGPDGKLAVFEAKYTFGLDPLQQYLVEFPDGRIQALSVAWDTRPKEQGGQRWFHLYSDSRVTPDDPLHWTKLNQNWNFMCAECHSTGVHKNYDAAQSRFATTFYEISVGCEACHGAGSRHVEWARSDKRIDDHGKGLMVRFDERTDISWTPDPATSLPRRNKAPALLRKEVETCGLCHALRGQLAEDWKPGQWLSDTHRVSLLERQRFEADGQMRDNEEVYNYAPFKQSKMFAEGVTCSDCHDPHSAALKAPGDAVCSQCHPADRYATADHRHHAEATPAISCASCHMPVRSYMVIDRRHDHSFRVPRPDLTVQFGTPNTCNDCHREKSADWAAETVARWFPTKARGFQTYASAFHAAWTEQPDAQAQLRSVAALHPVPALARASALAELSTPDTELARSALADPDPMVRLAALDMLEALPGDRAWAIASKSLSDQVRGVRIRAADLLASVPAASRPAAEGEAFERAAAEFVAAQRLNADRPEARTALGNFYARQGNVAGAEAEYRAAVRLDPTFSAAAINLSDLFRQIGRESDGEGVLRDALSRSDQDARLHHALGLALVRQKRHEESLGELRRAAVLDPGQPRYGYVYAIGLHSAGRREDALVALKQSLQRHPNNRDLLTAALAFSREHGDAVSALEYASRLFRLAPQDKNLSNLIEELQRKQINQGR